MLWQVQLQSHALVEHVWVTMSPGAYQKFAIFVVEMLDGTNTARYKPCAQFEVGIGRRRGHVTHSSQSQGRFHEQLVRFSCNEGAGQLGQFVYIRDDRVDRWAASLLGFLYFDIDESLMKIQYKIQKTYLILGTRLFQQREGTSQN